MIRRPPRSTQSRSSAASDVYKRQERFLAKNPDQRYATGGEAFVDLQRLEEKLGKRPVPGARSSQPTEISIPTVGTPPVGPGPTIGAIEDISIDDDLRRRRDQQGKKSPVGLVVLSILAAVGGALWYWQDRLPLDRWLSAFKGNDTAEVIPDRAETCLLYTSPSPRDLSTSRMPSSA